MAGTVAPDGSVYDAIYLAVSERQGVPFEQVKRELTHRSCPDDAFFYAWDEAINSAVALYCSVTGTEPRPDDD